MGFSSEPMVRLSTVENSKTLIFEFDASDKISSLKLIDANTNVLYYERIEDKNQFKKKFDFSELKWGDYSLIIENELSYSVHAITVSKDALILIEEAENYKPYFRIADERIAINFLNLNKELVTISIYDSENRTVFSEAIDDIIVEKAFNFEKAFADNYTVVIKTEQKSYYENILVE